MHQRLHQIVRLFQRAQLNELTGKEQEELDKLLKNPHLQKVYQEIQDLSFITGKLNEYHQYSTKQAYHRFYALQQHEKRRRIMRYAVGVAAVTVLLIGWLFWSDEKPDKREVFVERYEGIRPGGHKAILRLENGSEVPVGNDSIRIREEDGTEVCYAHGKFTYKPTDRSGDLIYNELTVPLAGECFIMLEDSTRVWINSGSKLKYPVRFAEKERRVWVEGEAYFKVAKNGKPFVVATSLGDIRVLGTSFNVKAYREEEKVAATLVEGKIAFAGKQTLTLQPGEQLVAFKDGKITRQPVEVEEYVAWKNGWFIFHDRRLEDMMTELARWYDIKIVYRRQSLKDLRFTGNLKRYDRVNVLLELLNRTNELNYSVDGNTVILY